jgi:uncharacterized repeat protein (TIGR01451 family)
MSSSAGVAIPRNRIATRNPVPMSGLPRLIRLPLLIGGLLLAWALHVPAAQAQATTLDIAITGSVDPVVAGSNGGNGNLIYNIVITNTGDDAADIVVENDLTLPGQGVAAVFNPVDGSFADGVWDIPSLTGGQTATLSVILDVASNAPAGAGLIADTATIVSAVPDLDPGDHQATLATEIRRDVDLTLTKTESVDPVIAGSGPDNLVYTVTVHNNGPSDASQVLINDELLLPPSPYVTAVYDPAIVPPAWSPGDLPAGADATLTVRVTVASAAVPAADAISNTASVDSIDADENLIDPDDDSAEQVTSIERQVELVLSKTDSVDPIVAGSSEDTLLYTVTLHNLGPSDASNVNVQETPILPAGVEIADVVAGSGGFWGYPNWLIPVLPAGGQAYLEMTMNVGPGTRASGTGIVNTAAVTAVDEPLIGDPETLTATEATAILPADPTPTPALGFWTLGLLIAALSVVGLFFSRRR